MNKYILMIFLMGTTFLISSCSDDDGVDPRSIVEVAQDTDDLSSLVDALTQADLVSALEADGPLTVFAPNNDAFQDLLNDNPAWSELADIDNTVLNDVLLYHVTSGTVKAADLSNGYVKSLSTGPNDENISLQVNTDDGVEFGGTASPIMTDIDADNGVIHTVDAVMLPPNVVNLALNNSAFSSLVAALTRADLTTNFVEILSGEGPFTVFAPTNDAFQDLLDDNDEWDSLADIPVATLEAVLTYHVVSGANVQADELVDGADITTLGGTLTTDLTNGAKLTTSSAQSVGIAITDVQGTNGVVHAVDAVLLP